MVTRVTLKEFFEEFTRVQTAPRPHTPAPIVHDEKAVGSLAWLAKQNVLQVEYLANLPKPAVCPTCREPASKPKSIFCSDTFHNTAGRVWPEICPACDRSYGPPSGTCIDAFHCCRDCIWDPGYDRIVSRCPAHTAPSP